VPDVPSQPKLERERQKGEAGRLVVEVEVVTAEAEDLETEAKVVGVVCA
jgi:hypothetical protein